MSFKRELVSTSLHGVTAHKTEIFTLINYSSKLTHLGNKVSELTKQKHFQAKHNVYFPVV
jgi:hypothetical protein